ncbi:acyltransferase family protein [Micromonospora wenchangensis]|uniref:acyltransferase family protein n=1 Tax=Micromonospora wenchangensis TaxID=1185415 RepID=UPI003D72689C
MAIPSTPVPGAATSATERLHALDAVRAGALLLGVVLHTTLSFLEPRTWVVGDVSTSPAMNGTYFVIHVFRMTLFFLIAGFFARLVLHRRGTGGFVRNRAVRILAPLVIFWPLVMASTVVAIIIAANLAGEEVPGATPMTPSTFPLTHLWFLYWLLVLYVLALAVRAVVNLLDADGTRRSRLVDPIVRTVVARDLTPLVVGAPLCVAFLLKQDWLLWYGVPPAENGLIPNPVALVAYGCAFGFGWLLQRQVDVIRVWERRYPRNLVAAVVLTGVALAMVGLTPDTEPEALGWHKVVYAVVYTLAVWAWTMGLIGAAMRYLSRPNPSIRYVADASYWVYVVHLPLVMALQAAVSQVALPWFVKFPAILLVTYPVTLLSYRYLVRYTFIGALLNGRRRRRDEKPATEAAVPQAAAR